MKQSKQAQKGAALIVALIVLIIITLLAISASRFTLLGTRSSLAYQLKNTAFQAAEVGLSRGIDSLTKLDTNLKLDDQAKNAPDAKPSLTTTLTLATGEFSNSLEVTVTRQASIIDNGSSLGEDRALPKIYSYAVESIATVDGHPTRSHLEQGYGALFFSE